MHMKLSLHLIKFITYAYLSPDLIASFSARDLWNCIHSGPILPVVVKTNGVKVPCSICITRSLYSLFFASSCLLRMDGMDELTWEAQSAFVTLTSKKAFWPLRQKPRALMSRRASALVLELRPERISVVTGWRWGSDSTSVKLSKAGMSQNNEWHHVEHWWNPLFYNSLHVIHQI